MGILTSASLLVLPPYNHELPFRTIPLIKFGSLSENRVASPGMFWHNYPALLQTSSTEKDSQ
jgi:hypothetical protein